MIKKIERIYVMMFTFFQNVYVGLFPHFFYKKIISKDSDVILSFTSYGTRIKSILPTVKSLFLQKGVTFRRIILWISFDDKKFIFSKLEKFQKRGLEIRYCQDYKSYKKVIETSRLYPNFKIITIDDDVIYPSHHFNKLVATSVEFPHCVCTYRAHLMTFDNQKVCKYSDWEFGSKGMKGPSHLLVGIGCQGILYPPNFFCKSDFPYGLIEKTAPKSDDLWLKFLELKKDVEVVKVFENNPPLANTYFTQKSALTYFNVFGSGNDEAMLKLCEVFKIELFSLCQKEKII